MASVPGRPGLRKRCCARRPRSGKETEKLQGQAAELPRLEGAIRDTRIREEIKCHSARVVRNPFVRQRARLNRQFPDRRKIQDFQLLETKLPRISAHNWNIRCRGWRGRCGLRSWFYGVAGRRR